MHDDLYSAVSLLTKFLDTQYKIHKHIWPPVEFEVISYSRWAVYEIQNRLLNAADHLPECVSGREVPSPREVVKAFIQDMEYCLGITTSPKAKLLFSTSINVSNNVLYILEL